MQFDFPLHLLQLPSPQGAAAAGLSQGAIAGIAIAAIVGAAAIAGAAVYFIRLSGVAK